jgi:hypothetical protein
MDQKQRLAPSAIGYSGSGLPTRIRMLLVARGSSWRRYRGRRWSYVRDEEADFHWFPPGPSQDLLRLSRRCWGNVPYLHPILPSIALTNINR